MEKTKEIKVEKYDAKKDTEKVGVGTKTKDVEEKKEAKDVKKIEPKKKEVVKKDVAIANGVALRISPKQSKYVCRIIRGKSVEGAVARLQAVIDEKRPVPMAGLEIGHRKGRGLAGGRFPKNACKAIMEVVKQAGANAVVNGIEDAVIRIAKADRAAAPLRRGGRRAKRTHVYIEIRNREETLKRRSSKTKSSEKFDSSNRKSSDSKNPEKFSSAGGLAKGKVENKVGEVKK